MVSHVDPGAVGAAERNSAKPQGQPFQLIRSFWWGHPSQRQLMAEAPRGIGSRQHHTNASNNNRRNLRMHLRHPILALLKYIEAGPSVDRADETLTHMEKCR